MYWVPSFVDYLLGWCFVRLPKNKLGMQYEFVVPDSLLKKGSRNPACSFFVRSDLDDSIKWLRPRRQVDQIQVKLTDQCNFECRHCIESSGRGKKSFFDFSQWRGFFSDFSSHNPDGVVTLSGGEPLLHPDINVIIDELLYLGLRVRLFTNGALLSTDYLSHELLASLDLIQLSLDGFTKEVNDKIRDLGAFDAVINALVICRSVDVPVRISCVLCEENVSDIIDNCEQFFETHCWDNVSLNFGRMENKGRGAEFWSGEENCLKLQATIMEEFSPLPERQALDSPKLCGYGNALGIDSQGKVCACSSNLSFFPAGLSFSDILVQLNSNWDRLYERAQKICGRCSLGWVCKAGCFLENKDSCDELRMNRASLRLMYGFLE